MKKISTRKPPKPNESEYEELIRLRVENEYMKAEIKIIKKEIALREEKEAARLIPLSSALMLSPVIASSRSFLNISTPVTTTFLFSSVRPTISTLSPVFSLPLSTIRTE